MALNVAPFLHETRGGDTIAGEAKWFDFNSLKIIHVFGPFPYRKRFHPGPSLRQENAPFPPQSITRLIHR
jgi:hypothetical protein